MDTVVDRLIRYAKVFSESDYYGQSGTPSNPAEFDMANLLVDELHGLGVDNAFVDEHCYVYAWLPATPGYEHLPAIGLIAHMDTTPDLTGKDVKPQIIHYEGGDIVLNREQNIVMEAARFPELAKFVGQDLVCTDPAGRRRQGRHRHHSPGGGGASGRGRAPRQAVPLLHP